jgi:hypothetical protein
VSIGDVLPPSTIKKDNARETRVIMPDALRLGPAEPHLPEARDGGTAAVKLPFSATSRC